MIRTNVHESKRLMLSGTCYKQMGGSTYEEHQQVGNQLSPGFLQRMYSSLGLTSPSIIALGIPNLFPTLRGSRKH